MLCTVLAVAVATVPSPWMDVSQTPKQRATALLAEMTLEEKITQVCTVTSDPNSSTRFLFSTLSLLYYLESDDALTNV